MNDVSIARGALATPGASRALQIPTLTTDLDGSCGTYRNLDAVNGYGVNSDPAAIGVWLASHAESPETHRKYAKEAWRLLLWSVRERGKAISSLNEADLIAYGEFLRNPVPVAVWCDPRGMAPFRRPLSPASQRESLLILRSMLEAWVDRGYLARCNMPKLRKKAVVLSRGTAGRFLDHESWDFLKGFIETLPRMTDGEVNAYERVRFVFRLLYRTGVRVSELAHASMADFSREDGRWWWTVVGKGRREDRVPASPQLMADLARYRTHNGLASEPRVNEDRVPLLLGVAGRHVFLSSSAVYRIVKDVFRRASSAADAAGHREVAERLARASTHWMRHTAATHQLEAGVPIQHVKDNLRHADLTTTSRYIHSEDNARHDSVSAVNL